MVSVSAPGRVDTETGHVRIAKLISVCDISE
jgi:hypothetical protein